MKITSINNIGINTSRGIKYGQKNPTSLPFSNAQINDISNIYYKPISFGRSTAEHKSWGAQIDPETKETSFKILTYPDSKKVTVTVKKRNSRGQEKTYTLDNRGNGIFETAKKIPAGEVEHGDRYFYTIYKGNGDIDKVKDPYSFRQETLLGESTIYDHSLYQWQDKDWFENNQNRISRRANSKNGLKSVKEARIYEFNTASLTKKGTFDSAKNTIKNLPQMGFNAIEIMPVENTFSFNWGYDGVDKMAPSEHLGGPDSLKAFIDYAHSIGLNVIMDMVPNHLGPDGASLKQTGPYIKGQNAFGEAFNFEGKDSTYVRDYIVNAALNWLENYHCDGLRLDMTKFMDSDYTMKQIAAEVNYHKPDAFLIAEDSREKISVNEDGTYFANNDEPHDKRVLNPLLSGETGEGSSEETHCSAIEQISGFNTSLSRLGYNSEWDFNYFHALEDALYGNIDLDKFEKACYCAQDRVKYVMSHDEIGNKEGTRLIAKLMMPMLHLRENITADSKDIERAKAYQKAKGVPEDSAMNTVLTQKAHFTSEKLAIMLLTGKLDKYNTSGISSKRWIQAIEKAFAEDILRPLGIKASSGINYDKVSSMFKKSLSTYKMALARTYSIPGPKMVFQGDEKADMTPFRFFRQFDSVKNEDYLYVEKGYRTGIKALQDSVQGILPYSEKGRGIINRCKALTKDLNKINEQNPALTKGVIIADSTVKHYASQVFATHSKDNESGNEIFAITNFRDEDYPRQSADNYYIKFPEGKWVEILNTDDRRYGGSGKFNNTKAIVGNGTDNLPIKLSAQSTSIFKKVG